ncbi:hypothetical protein M569_16235 [Genlisea aurea]|uniref:Reverse transcriptase zinc-binding domain-containing protein n=1 Tax=Genlisea aurea TaxID=192259 RepID=S8D7C2_9LAMI|nr:hypothetical protein M569_16235 [Genlisea aurea]
MGFRDLLLFNKALIAMQGWRLLSRPTSLPARILNFGWRLGNNILPLKANLARRRICQDFTCDICGGEHECWFHALVSCPFSQATPLDLLRTHHMIRYNLEPSVIRLLSCRSLPPANAFGSDPLRVS